MALTGTVQLLSAATAANGAPSGATAGQEWNRHNDDALIALKSTAGSGTMTVTIRLWGFVGGAVNDWVQMANINGGSAIPENGTDSIRYGELVTGLSCCERLYAEVVAIAGTATAVSLWAVRRERAGQA